MHEPEQEEVITLIDEDGKEQDFIILDIVELEGLQYVILLPFDDEEEEAVILKFAKDNDGNDILVEIEDDEEWDKVAGAWEAMMVEEDI